MSAILKDYTELWQLQDSLFSYLYNKCRVFTYNKSSHSVPLFYTHKGSYDK